ncbi:Fanconi anemia group M protein [Geodia barretti]|nr:Fanconi anemia group M protein [Geodia barretti]
MARHLRDLRRKLTASSSRVVGCGGVGRSPRSSHYTSPSQCSAPDLFYGHPKLRKLEEVVLEHFRRCGAQSADGTGGRGPNTETRVMVFSQYRESVQEIADLLSSHAPLVRVMSFVGHGTTGKSTSKGLTQREQTEVVRKFREGGYNTLVATCVGEEGLDIGEVDLIVCFDAHKSPIRLVQRMGRTGRKRSGRIVVIVTQGKEEQTYRKSQSNKHSIHKAIRQNSRSLNFFPHAPRMVPRHMTPQSLKQPMTVEEYKPSERGQRGRGRRQPRLSLGPPALSRASQRGCLSHQELEEWSKRFSLPDRELRACERAVGECFRHQPILGLSHLKRGKQGVLDTPIDNRVNRNHSTTGTPLNASVVQKFPLSLSKWIRWQTGQTHFKMVGPSEKGKQFVSLLEFLDLMYSCDGLGESYATEMAAFFDPEDIRTVGAAASTEGVSTAGSGGEKGRGGRRARRRLASGSSDDDEFLDEGVGRSQSVGRGEQCSKPTTNEDVLVTEEMSPHLPDRQSPIPSVDDRDLPAALQHAIPRPPSCDSLDWLDDIQPSQISTPLPSRSSSTSANPHSPPHTSRDFQFAFPHTPPSSRKSKTPFVTPLTTPPHRKPEHNRQPVGDTSTTDEASAHFESMDLFNDISSAVLFDDFSDVGTSQTAQEQSVKAVQEEMEEREVAEEAGEGGSIDDALNITSIPESEDDGEEGEEIQENGDEKGGMEVHCDSQNGDVSEESLIGGCGQRRRKFARPDFLLTQAPPKSPPISPMESSGTAPGSGDYEDFLLEPLSRRLRKRGVFVERERESGEAGRKKVRLEPEEYLDKEAELSGEGEGSGEEEEVERGADEYNMEDSFINDNSVLTQVTPSQLPKEKLRSKKFSPVNMADVYRQSLMSPHSDHLFVGRRGGGGYRMVLSQRHQILNRCLAKAGGRRLFDGERRRGEDVSSESGESEAEEVRVCYGEEDEKEIEDSQSIGEPWEWGDEEESGGTRTHHPRLSGEEDIVSPSLLVSVEPQPTPSCYNLEVEGWLSESGSCWSDEDPTTASIILD